MAEVIGIGVTEGIADSVDVVATDVESAIGAQRRRRRLRFWFGFAVIALIGGLWAGLSKEPIGPGLFGDGAFIDEAPAVEIAEFQDVEVPTTTGVPAPAPLDLTTTTGP